MHLFIYLFILLITYTLLRGFGNNGNIWAQAVCSKWPVFDIAHEVIRDLYRMFKTVKP